MNKAGKVLGIAMCMLGIVSVCVVKAEEEKNYQSYYDAEGEDVKPAATIGVILLEE